VKDGKGLIKDLAIGSILTGRVSEVHLHNMKIYPFVFIDNVDRAEISYDIITDLTNTMPGSHSTVVYVLRFTDSGKPETLDSGAENLKKALSALFTQNIKLVLKDHNEQVLWEEKKDVG
jgi:hypothetical protein